MVHRSRPPLRGPPRVTVLAVAHNRLLRDSIATALRHEPGLRIVVAAPPPAAPLSWMAHSHPAVVLLEAGLGAPAVAAVKQADPLVQVIVMDLDADAADLVAFVRAGVRGFVSTEATPDDLVGTIHAVLAGQVVVPAGLTAALVSGIVREPGAAPIPESPPAQAMTRRERDVLRLIAEGRSNREIAQRLCITVNTVKGHVHSLLHKLALHTRLEMAAFAHAAAGGSLPSKGIAPLH